MAERSDSFSGGRLLPPCARWKKLQRKMTADYCWIDAQENIAMFSKSGKDRNSFIWLPLFERPVRTMFSKLSHRCNDLKLLCELANTH